MMGLRAALTLRSRAGLRLAIVTVCVALASCRGARQGGSPAPVPPAGAAPGAAGVTSPDSAKPNIADSAALKRIADSVARDSAAKLPVPAVAAVTPPTAPKKKPAPTTRPCVMNTSESPPETRLLYSRLSETVSNTFIGGGFVGHCEGENNRLRADSAEQFQAAGIVNLYGNVVYEEPGKMQVTATHATYFTREGRLYADGNVVATQLSTGSTFRGPSIEYFRSMPDRPASRLVAPARSTASLIEKDSLGKLMPATTVVANRFEDTGDSLLMAWGDVQIDRETINGRSDSASFDKASETARLIRGARIVNRDTVQSFTLVGDTIDLYSKARTLERVVAKHKATATSKDLVLAAERVDMRLKEQRLEEAFAFGAGRARATTPQQDVVADSLRIRLVDKVAREVRAIGNAITMGTPDSLKMRTTEKDILRGDSVFAFFDSVSAVDTTKGAVITEIQALGNASSLFHFASSRGRDAPPAINYVRGLRIFVHFDTGTVRDVRVDSAASGVYLEPVPDSLSDTTAAGRAKGTPAKVPPTPVPGSAGAPPVVPPKRPPVGESGPVGLLTPAAASAFRRRP